MFAFTLDAAAEIYIVACICVRRHPWPISLRFEPVRFSKCDQPHLRTCSLAVCIFFRFPPYHLLRIHDSRDAMGKNANTLGEHTYTHRRQTHKTHVIVSSVVCFAALRCREMKCGFTCLNHPISEYYVCVCKGYLNMMRVRVRHLHTSKSSAEM